jgi:nucleoside-diphosphate-sugar epimerase
MVGKLLVVGAVGVVGRNTLKHFEALGGWELVGVSRRKPDFASSARFIQADLRDSADCRDKLSELGDVSHILYCANYEKPNLIRGWTEPDHVEINGAMLRNLLEAVEPRARSLERIVFMQGTKAYGAAAGPFKVPAKESDPRYLAPNFYYVQEDHVRSLQEGKRWTWTVLRPQFVCGYALGSSMNGLTPIGAYAAISRELGQPLRFPGGEPRPQEATDARLLAKAVHWAATSPRCANEIFNIVNGDCYTWDALWPKIARLFDMELGPHAPAALSRIMVDKGPVWHRIVEKHGLERHSLDELVPTWQFAERLTGYGSRANFSSVSGIKARKFGFHECQDSEEMWLDWLKMLQEERILPS